jgi:hypothetical protein
LISLLFVSFSVSVVTQPPDGTSARLSQSLRWGLFVFGLGAASLLTVAAMLTPNPAGFGTHRQLGLPPCTFVALWNLPCPSCGMTTAFSHFVHGQFAAALRCNAGGLLLATLATLVVPWALISAAWGRYVVRPPSERTLLLGAAVIVIVTLVGWIGRLSAAW